MRIDILALTSACLILAGVQSASSEDNTHSHKVTQHKVHTIHNTGFVKPGAAVALSHDYDGVTGLGEFETLSVTLSHIYQDGTLSVALLASPDVLISAFNPIQKMPLSHGSTLDVPIQFSSLKQGDFTLSLEAVYESSDGHESRRVLSIPVTIGGGKFEKASVADKTVTHTTYKSGLIGLPAIEVIE